MTAQVFFGFTQDQIGTFIQTYWIIPAGIIAPPVDLGLDRPHFLVGNDKEVA
jgi:hypothetical protein